jgi:thioester reductase-like protein
VADTDIAVVGVGCRFPDAPDPRQFWRNIDDGLVSMRELPEETLRAAGVSEETLRAPDFVRVAATLDGAAEFAGDFFGYPPKEAELIDPAQRLFLEASWEALESAGHPPRTGGPLTGVFGGGGPSTYTLAVQVARALVEGVAAVGDDAELVVGGLTDFLSARVAYKLNLRGPSVTVHTACSSGLTAVHYAVLSLLSGECDIALAGAAAVNEPLAGYRYKPNAITSRDGFCRPFDAVSTGTSFSSGVGVVALRRLGDALADGDPVLAVVRGSAVGNDGADRSGFTAPSPGGLTDVVSAALRVAGVGADELRYVEAHGSGTALGDQIELRGLIDALRRNGATGTGYCGLGSVKANVGHCGPSAGIAGFIKAVHVVRTGTLPPHPAFERARDPGILAESPFFVDTEGGVHTDEDRHVLVNSMGLGGSIATAVLAPPPAPTRPAAPPREQVRLVLSARNRAELDALCRTLADELDAGELPIADVAHTLRVGRHAFAERRVVTAPADKITRALRLPRPPAARTTRVENPTGERFDPESVADDVEAAACDAWLRGAEVDWEALSGGNGRRVTLPTYPFRRRRYWAMDNLPPVAAPRTVTVSAPRPSTSDDVEAGLLDIWRDLFGTSTIGVDDEFGTLGGTSLLSVRMSLEVQKHYDVQLNLHRAGGSKATVRRIAEIVRGRQDTEHQPADGDGALVDADLQLPLGDLAAGETSGKDVLLTGATGFLGAFLLPELVKATGRRIYCLVRAADETEAWQRLVAAAARFGLPAPDPELVHPVPGDLRDVGAALARHGELAARVGQVLHCAARVVFTEPYRVLRDDNVLPMVELLCWMRAHGIRDFGFVSSVAATGEALGASGPHTILETREQPLDPRHGGYGVSKWAGERILERAEQDGMRVRVFRPGFVLGSTVTGACNTSDVIWHMLAGGLAVGAHPLDDRALPMAPVNVVARAIAELSVSPGAVGRAYHLMAESALSPKRLFALLGEAGLPTSGLSSQDWQRTVAAQALETGNEVLSTTALYELDEFHRGERDLQATAWHPWLAGHGLDPAPTGALLRSCLSYLAGVEPAFAELLPEISVDTLEVR